MDRLVMIQQLIERNEDLTIGDIKKYVAANNRQNSYKTIQRKLKKILKQPLPVTHSPAITKHP